MTVEIADIREGLATNLRTIADTARQVSAYRLAAPTPPALLVIGFGELTKVAMGSWETDFIVQGFAGLALERASWVRLDKWLSPYGAANVWDAIESDKTLGGVVSDTIVTRCDGAQIIEIQATQPSSEMLGSTWHVQIEL